MISLAGATVLKDAGFPQEPSIDISGIDGSFFGSFYYIIKPNSSDVAPNFLNQREYEDLLKTPSCDIADVVKIPSLPELVAACSPYIFDEEFNLHATHEEGKIKWCACYISPLNLTGKAKYLCVESTAEEAVTNLWLVVNKKH